MNAIYIYFFYYENVFFAYSANNNVIYVIYNVYEKKIFKQIMYLGALLNY